MGPGKPTGSLLLVQELEKAARAVQHREPIGAQPGELIALHLGLHEREQPVHRGVGDTIAHIAQDVLEHGGSPRVRGLVPPHR
eukprot:9790255-Alexandrium_andersonii.AAC.1